MSRPVSGDLDRPEARPYFLWDEDVSNAELRRVLDGPDGPARDRLMAKLLREARDMDVWSYVKPEDVARALPRLERRLGRRYAFWKWLIDGWRADGILQ